MRQQIYTFENFLGLSVTARRCLNADHSLVAPFNCVPCNTRIANESHPFRFLAFCFSPCSPVARPVSTWAHYCKRSAQQKNFRVFKSENLTLQLSFSLEFQHDNLPVCYPNTLCSSQCFKLDIVLLEQFSFSNQLTIQFQYKTALHSQI